MAIWAENAASDDINDPGDSKVSLGWVGPPEKPPHDTFNWWMNRADTVLLGAGSISAGIDVVDDNQTFTVVDENDVEIGTEVDSATGLSLESVTPALDCDGRYLYVKAASDTDVLVFDLTDLASSVLFTIPASANGPTNNIAAIACNGQYLAISGTDGTDSTYEIFDVTPLYQSTPAAPISVGVGTLTTAETVVPRQAVAINHTRAFFGHRVGGGANRLTSVTLSTAAIDTQVATSFTTSADIMWADEYRLYATEVATDDIDVFDLATLVINDSYTNIGSGTHIRQIIADGLARLIVLNDDNSALGYVTIIESDGGAQIAEIGTGSRIRAFNGGAFDGQYLAVADFDTDDLWHYNINTLARVARTVHTGELDVIIGTGMHVIAQEGGTDLHMYKSLRHTGQFVRIAEDSPRLARYGRRAMPVESP